MKLKLGENWSGEQMKLTRLKIENFRSIRECELLFAGHTVLVGDNNTGKSTVLEAIDLVLGPERISRYPVIDEHDFYAGEYIGTVEAPITIGVEALVTDLSPEQKRHFRNHLEWWDTEEAALLEGPPPEETDREGVVPALRLGFNGSYDEEEDDFIGRTYFLSPQRDDGDFDVFGKTDKRRCGFLFLHTLRTGSRALSLERGSLMDVILRLKELRPQMWEDVLEQLRELPVAVKEELGVTEILTTVQEMVRSIVPSEWAENPHMRVSALTRAHLRQVLTVFMTTGATRKDGSEYAAPFQRQGTGTVNTLVLALLSMIADLKQNVIFAMEEPEIAIPPHAQKQIINRVTAKSAQGIFTSHSPYVIEEFSPANVIVVRRDGGRLSGIPATYPPAVKPKAYRDEFRRRFCEALLARRVLVAEGRTEYGAYPAAARRLHDLNPESYRSLEACGIAIVNAETDTQVAPLGAFFRGLGKVVFAVFDKQGDEARAAIEEAVDHAFEAPEKGFENVVLNGTAETALRRYAADVIANGDWPPHLSSQTPSETTEADELKASLGKLMKWGKGSGSAADLLTQCSEEEMPEFIRGTLRSILAAVETLPDEGGDGDGTPDGDSGGEEVPVFGPPEGSDAATPFEDSAPPPFLSL